MIFRSRSVARVRCCAFPARLLCSDTAPNGSYGASVRRRCTANGLGRDRAAARLRVEVLELAGSDAGVVHDLVPREASDEPTGCNGDGGFAEGVIHRLVLVPLTVELDED